MNFDPKEEAINRAVATVQAAIEKQLRATLPKIIGDAFEAGQNEFAAAINRAMQSVGSPGTAAPESKPFALSFGSTSPPSKDGRAARGSVRKAVVAALAGRPEGVSTAEIVAKAMTTDPTISAGGITNELNRKKGQIYLNEQGHWRLIPGLKLGGDFYQLLNPNPEKDEATER